MQGSGDAFRVGRRGMIRGLARMSYPDDWPVGCPPPDSQTADGLVYRIVNHDPIRDEDFLSQFELGRAASADPCLRRSLSVFTKATDALHRRKLTPRLGGYIAEGTLEASHGQTKHPGGDKSSHTEWWPYAGIDRKATFNVIQGY